MKFLYQFVQIWMIARTKCLCNWKHIGKGSHGPRNELGSVVCENYVGNTYSAENRQESVCYIFSSDVLWGKASTQRELRSTIERMYLCPLAEGEKIWLTRSIAIYFKLLKSEDRFLNWGTSNQTLFCHFLTYVKRPDVSPDVAHYSRTKELWVRANVILPWQFVCP